MDIRDMATDLKARIDYLEEIHHFTVDTLEMAASLGDFQSTINQLQQPSAILRETGLRVQRLIPFRSIGFYLVDEESSDFYLADCLPAKDREILTEEINFLIDNGTFAWALREKRAIRVSTKDFERQMLLHVMATQARIRGLFAGILPRGEKNIPEVSFSLLSIILLNSSNALESFELYKMVQKNRSELEDRIKERTLKLAEANQNLQLEIAEHRLTETRLRESEERYRRLVENAPLGIVSVDRHGNIIDINSPFISALDSPSAEAARAINLFTFPPLIEAGLSGNLRKCLATGKTGDFEAPYRGQAGKESFLRYHLTPIRDPEGKISGVQAVVEEITERKRLEGQLLQAQKMEAIGTLAGGIAHDFNNILAAILGFLELANLDTAENSRIKYNLQQSMKAAHRAKDLVQQILAFSRQNKRERKPLHMGPIVKEGLKFLRASLPTTIAIKENIEEDLGTVEADPTQIHQVLMNLCTNAADAMREQPGVLEISLIKMEETSGLYPELDPGPYLRLRVSDTGQGMTREVLKRIFDPYFTTKETGKGTGLGLAVVHGIVKSYKGHIAVSSEVKKGTTFDIYLPRTDNKKVAWEADRLEPLPLGKLERILFVDDEAAIAEIGQRMLEHLGYEVVVKTGSMEALELFRTQPEGFDLVITDMTMPNMSGDKLAKEILRIRPDLPIILCTGFSESISEEKAKALGVREFALKPLVMKDLAGAVGRALH